MFRKARGLQPADKAGEPGEVIGIKRFFTADRKAHAVDGDRKTFGHGAELRDRAATVAHVVFCMDLEPGHVARCIEDRVEMLGFVAYARAIRQTIVASRSGIKHGRSSSSGLPRPGSRGIVA